MNKSQLIEEIQDQLKALNVLVKMSPTLDFEQYIALLDLQFRLKCKLYELTN